MTQEHEVRRLTKSKTDRMIDGVCGGIAAYFHLDPTLVRIAWVLLAIFGGAGIVLYIVAMIIMPSGSIIPQPADAANVPPTRGEKNTRFWGILLVVVGAVWLGGNLGFPLFHHWWWMRFDMILPVLLILAGVAFLYGGRNSLAGHPHTSASTEGGMASGSARPSSGTTHNRVYRSRTDRKFMGVCGGFAQYLDIDPTIVRLLFVFAVFGSFGGAVVAYLIMALVIPEEPLSWKPGNY